MAVPLYGPPPPSSRCSPIATRRRRAVPRAVRHRHVAEVFPACWTVLIVGCLWWMAGRDVVGDARCFAFPPVAVDSGRRTCTSSWPPCSSSAWRSSGFSRSARRSSSRPASGGGDLVRPGGGCRPRWRSRCGRGPPRPISVALSPAAWRPFLDIFRTRGPLDRSAFLAMPTRSVAAGLVRRWRPVVVVADRRPLFVVAIALALPTLVPAFATLVALRGDPNG